MKISYKLLTYLLLVLITVSCTKEDSIEPEVNLEENLLEEPTNELNNFLQNAAFNLVSVINDENVRDELKSFATIRTDEEVHMPFSELLETEKNSRQSSVLLSKIKELSEFNKNSRSDNSLSSLLETLVSENVSIYAPYFAEDHYNSDSPITLAWWDGIDTSGVIQGVRFEQNSNSRVQNQIL